MISLSDDTVRQYLQDPEALLDEVDRLLEAVPLEHLPLSLMSDKKSEGKKYREVVDNKPVHQVLDTMLLKVSEQLKRVCCERLNYCKLKREKAATIDVVKAVADGLISAAFSFPIPIATVTIYCVQSAFLDRLCGCD